MTAVGSGQQESQAVGSGFESLPCQNFLTIYPYYFSIPEISETPTGSPTKFFGTVRQKNVEGKSWYFPLPLIHKLFRYQKFSETQHRRVPLQNVSALWDKKFSPENLDTPPPPLLIHKLFRYRKFSETQHGRVLQRNFSALWDKKFPTKNIDTPSPHPPSLLSINFFDTRTFVKHRRVPIRSSSVLWDKNNFDRKSWYPPPLLSLTFFGTRNFLKHRRVPRRNFLALWDKNFSTENRDTLLHKVQKSVVELMFVKALWKLISKQLFCFYPFAKVDQNICSWSKNMPVLAGRLVLNLLNSKKHMHVEEVLVTYPRWLLPFIINHSCKISLILYFQRMQWYPSSTWNVLLKSMLWANSQKVNNSTWGYFFVNKVK